MRPINSDGSSFQLGKSNNTTYSTGAFNNLRILNISLTSVQIQELDNNSQLTTPSGISRANLIRHFRLSETNTPNNGIILDYSDNKAHGVFHTNATQPSNAAVTGIDKGYQTALGQFNRYPILDGNVPNSSNIAAIPILRNPGDYIEVKIDVPSGKTCLFNTVGGGPDLDISMILNTNGINTFYSVDDSNIKQFIGLNGPKANEIDNIRITSESDLTYSFLFTNKDDTQTNFNPTATFFADKVFNGFISDVGGVKLNVRIFYVDINGTKYNPNDPDLFTINGSLSNQINVYGQDHNSSTDIFGNPFQYPWKEGMLNFVGGNHKGIALTNEGPTTNNIFNFFTAILPLDVANTPVLLSNRTTNDGLQVYLTAPIRARAASENGGALTEILGDIENPQEEWKFVGYSNNANGNAGNIYMGNESAAMSVSGASNQDIGTPGYDGVYGMTLFTSPDGTKVFDGMAARPVVYIDDIISLESFNEFRQYVLDNVINP